MPTEQKLRLAAYLKAGPTLKTAPNLQICANQALVGMEPISAPYEKRALCWRPRHAADLPRCIRLMS